jgi:hypothetical protein
LLTRPHVSARRSGVSDQQPCDLDRLAAVGRALGRCRRETGAHQAGDHFELEPVRRRASEQPSPAAASISNTSSVIGYSKKKEPRPGWLKAGLLTDVGCWLCGSQRTDPSIRAGGRNGAKHRSRQRATVPAAPPRPTQSCRVHDERAAWWRRSAICGCCRGRRTRKLEHVAAERPTQALMPDRLHGLPAGAATGGLVLRQPA